MQAGDEQCQLARASAELPPLQSVEEQQQARYRQEYLRQLPVGVHRQRDRTMPHHRLDDFGMCPSQDLSTYVELGAYMQVVGWQFRPLLGVQYTHLTQDQFRETGADSLNLAIAKNQTDSSRLSAGARLSNEYYVRDSIVLVPQFSARWMSELADTNQVVRAGFADSASGTFLTQGANLGDQFLLAGAGLAVNLGDSTRVFVNYDLQATSNHTAHIGSGGLQLIW